MARTIGGRFAPGTSGNPRGRPGVGQSLAELIRTSGGEQDRLKRLVDQVWAMAIEPHADPRLRISAMEWIAKHGWPEESRGTTTVTADTGPVTIVHEHYDAGSTKID
jgi:hypothetical protein